MSALGISWSSIAGQITFNEFFLGYVALFTLSLFSLVGGVARTDAESVYRSLHGELSTSLYAGFLAFVAIGLALLWLSDIIPAFVLTAYWLRKRRPWGYAFTVVLLVKIATLGGAVLAMVFFMVRAGQAAPWPQIIIFGTLTLVSVLLLVRLLLVIHPDSTAVSTTSATDGR